MALSPREISYSWAGQKCQVFACPTASPAPLQGSRAPEAQHLTTLHRWHAPSSPDLSLQARLAGKIPTKMHPSGDARVGAKPRSSEGQPCRHPSGACVRLGTWVHPPERDGARRLRLRQPRLAPAVEHLARSARPSRHGKTPQPRERVQERSGFD